MATLRCGAEDARRSAGGASRWKNKHGATTPTTGNRQRDDAVKKAREERAGGKIECGAHRVLTVVREERTTMTAIS